MVEAHDLVAALAVIQHLLTNDLVLQKGWTGLLLIGDAEPMVWVGGSDAIVNCHMLLVLDLDSVFLHIGELAVGSFGNCFTAFYENNDKDDHISSICLSKSRRRMFDGEPCPPRMNANNYMTTKGPSRKNSGAESIALQECMYHTSPGYVQKPRRHQISLHRCLGQHCP